MHPFILSFMHAVIHTLIVSLTSPCNQTHVAVRANTIPSDRQTEYLHVHFARLPNPQLTAYLLQLPLPFLTPVLS